MRRASGVDAEMLAADRAPDAHLHIGALMILDARTADGRVDSDDLARALAYRASAIEPLRERIVEVPLGLDRPVWVEDDRFDAANHVRRISLPAPGGRQELASLVGHLLALKLDRRRPLWEMWCVNGLADGRLAVVAKVHHALADGSGAALLMARLLRTEPAEIPAEPPRPRGATRAPSGAELLARSAGTLTTLPVRAARAALNASRSASKAVRINSSGTTRGAALPFQAPAVSLNRRVSSSRSVAFTGVRLADVHDIRHALDATVNDVVLALCSGALRRYLADRGERPERPLVAAVPVSPRGHDDDALGNRVSGWFVDLATDLDDEIERVRRIRDATREAKQLHSSGVEDVVMEVADLPAPFVWTAGAWLLGSLRLGRRLPAPFNLLVSNVPGPPVPLYLGPARVLYTYPFGPVFASIGLNITALSSHDEVQLGITTCPQVVDDPWAIADAVSETMRSLQGLIGGVGRSG